METAPGTDGELTLLTARFQIHFYVGHSRSFFVMRQILLAPDCAWFSGEDKPVMQQASMTERKLNTSCGFVRNGGETAAPNCATVIVMRCKRKPLFWTTSLEIRCPVLLTEAGPFLYEIRMAAGQLVSAGLASIL